jgi:hypothetical protein
MEESDIRNIKFENSNFEVVTGFKFSMSPFIQNDNTNHGFRNMLKLF